MKIRQNCKKSAGGSIFLAELQEEIIAIISLVFYNEIGTEGCICPMNIYLAAWLNGCKIC